MIPVAGWASTGGKLAVKGSKAIEDAQDASKAVDNVNDGAKEMGKAATKQTIQQNEVTTYKDFVDRSVGGDNLEGHEVWQHANLKANGLATDMEGLFHAGVKDINFLPSQWDVLTFRSDIRTELFPKVYLNPNDLWVKEQEQLIGTMITAATFQTLEGKKLKTIEENVVENIKYHAYDNGLLIKEYVVNETVFYEVVSKVEYKEEAVTVDKPKENKFLDSLQFGLDIAGLVPGFGEIADGVNGAIYTARGDKLNATLSFTAMIPFAGWASTSGKLVVKGSKAIEEAQDASKAVDNVTDGAKGTGNATEGGIASKKPYSNSRPSYGKGQVDQVWGNAIDPITEKVYDPSGVEIIWDKSKTRGGQWDMGHLPGEKYSDMHELYMNGTITKKEFLDWYRDPANYRPELPSTNRSHKHE
ncbi:GH-E family nuclease [Psychrobacillus sp. FSL K6-4615]|uniref:GH-E family nuclease n=1 Tax=Psychrobacillus TaxID=1221880 RepID=UPI0030F80E04